MFMVRKLSGNISRAEFNFSKISFNFIGFVIDDKAYHFFSVAHKVKFNLQKGWTRSEIGFEIIYRAKKKKKETWTARGCKTCISEKEFLIYFWTPARTGTNKKRETETERERERMEEDNREILQENYSGRRKKNFQRVTQDILSQQT